MAESQKKVSVVICAYTLARWNELQAAIRSVQAQILLPSEIILVIDHNPELYQRAAEAFPTHKVIENQQAPGLSGARNTGITAAKEQVIAFMDEDAVAEPEWLMNMLSCFENPLVAGVGGDVRPSWAAEPPSWFPEEFYWVVGCSYKGLPTTCAPVRNPIGCSMSFRKDALVEAGGFRNGIGRIGTIPMGCEETELSIRIRQMHPEAVILHQPVSIVHHWVPEWRTRWSYFVNRCFSEGRSKALISQYTGPTDSLSSEGRYITETLSKGILRGFAQAFIRSSKADLLRSLSIITGLIVTSTGYLSGILTQYLLKAKPNVTPLIQNEPVDGREYRSQYLPAIINSDTREGLNENH